MRNTSNTLVLGNTSKTPALDNVRQIQMLFQNMIVDSHMGSDWKSIKGKKIKSEGGPEIIAVDSWTMQQKKKETKAESRKKSIKQKKIKRR